MPDVKLSPVIEKGPTDILLGYVSHNLSIVVLSLNNQTPDSTEPNYLDISAPVRVLSWLDDPHLLPIHLVFLDESSIFAVLTGSDVVGLRNIGKGVFMSVVTVVVE